jgi:hypothetical protein
VSWIAQVLPFQYRASVNTAPPSLKYSPVAVQLVSEAHETPCKELAREWAGFGGVAWIAQVLPSQCSASVNPAPELV